MITFKAKVKKSGILLSSFKLENKFLVPRKLKIFKLIAVNVLNLPFNFKKNKPPLSKKKKKLNGYSFNDE